MSTQQIFRQQTVSTSIVQQVLQAVSPGWFTSVMGTGILAIGLQLAPIHVGLYIPLSQLLWLIDVVLFTVLLLLWIAQAMVYPKAIIASLHDPVHAQLWGAPPMASFTVATGFLVIGAHLTPIALSTQIAQVLWIFGVILSIIGVYAVPFLMFTRHELALDTMTGSWLLPIVPPIVASVPGALLASTWPVAWRGNMLGLAYALWGIGILLSFIVIAQFYTRLAYHKIPAGALVTTLWLVVGPLGQSVAGINALGNAALAIWPTWGHALQAGGLLYGLPVWGLGIYWLGLAIGATLRTAFKHLPFTMGWWAFTFPVGVLTSGTYALYARTGASLFAWSGVVLLALLALMWSLVAWRTIHQVIQSLRQNTVVHTEGTSLDPSLAD